MNASQKEYQIGEKVDFKLNNEKVGVAEIIGVNKSGKLGLRYDVAVLNFDETIGTNLENVPSFCISCETKLDESNVKMTKSEWLKESTEETTEKNAEIIGGFIEHCKQEGFDIPETLFESYFGA